MTGPHTRTAQKANSGIRTLYGKRVVNSVNYCLSLAHTFSHTGIKTVSYSVNPRENTMAGARTCSLSLSFTLEHAHKHTQYDHRALWQYSQQLHVVRQWQKNRWGHNIRHTHSAWHTHRLAYWTAACGVSGILTAGWSPGNQVWNRCSGCGLACCHGNMEGTDPWTQRCACAHTSRHSWHPCLYNDTHQSWGH